MMPTEATASGAPPGTSTPIIVRPSSSSSTERAWPSRRTRVDLVAEALAVDDRLVRVALEALVREQRLAQIVGSRA